MKKLIIAAAAIAMTVVANAATCSWSAMPIDPIATGATVTSAYGFDTGTMTQDAFLALFAANDTSWQTSGVEAMYDSGMAMGSIDGYSNGGAVNVWAAFFDDKGNVLVTDAVAATIGGAGQDPSPFIDTTAATAAGVFTASTGAYTANGAGWYAVPEPTSGFLMLLGMAGLALKRKRA